MTDAATPPAQDGLYRPAGTLDVASALDPYTGPWDARRAAHLYRRAGFGAAPPELAHISAMPMNKAVDGFVHFPSTASLPAQPSDLPNVAEVREAYRALLMGGMNKTDSAALEARKQVGMVQRRGYVALATWWLNRMLASPAPLQEKMTLLWHGHFASATGTKGILPQEGFAQNQLFRQYALGNIRELTLAVSRDPAMLKYLDNARSRAEHPNENYARELMELFTLGIGNYTENDVREGARAFTGWSVARGGGEFAFNARFHDDGTKTFLGARGNFDGGDIVRIIFAQPAAARHFASRLLSFFVYSDPEPALVDAVAALIKKNDFNALPVVSTLLRSNVFYSDRAYRALVKSPAEFVVGTLALAGRREVEAGTLPAMARMGQVLFRPPSVKGWDGGAAWLNSQTLLTRENYVSGLLGSQAATDTAMMTTAGLNPAATAQSLVATILQGDASAASVERVVAYLNGTDASALGAFSGENYQERVRGAAYLTMAMPAYQLA